MKILVIVIAVVIVIALILLIIALFTRKDYSVEREIVIAKPKNEVFNYVKLLKNQDNYSKWNTMDPNVRKEYKGVDGTVGFVSAWDSDNKNVGSGEQEIKKITEGKRIDYELRFIKPFTSTANVYMATDSESANATRVKWGFKSRMNFPMNLMLLFMDMEKMIGNDFATGLSNLKTVLERKKHQKKG